MTKYYPEYTEEILEPEYKLSSIVRRKINNTWYELLVVESGWFPGEIELNVKLAAHVINQFHTAAYRILNEMSDNEFINHRGKISSNQEDEKIRLKNKYKNK
jgi:hypothetical protein